MRLSIVVPCFNEEANVDRFYRDSLTVIEGRFPADLETEYLFIDDGSTDGTFDAFRKLASIDSRVHYISFSRNFGKEAAIYAGLENATGDYVVTMDVDGQDPADKLPEMFSMLTGSQNAGGGFTANLAI